MYLGSAAWLFARKRDLKFVRFAEQYCIPRRRRRAWCVAGSLVWVPSQECARRPGRGGRLTGVHAYCSYQCLGSWRCNERAFSHAGAVRQRDESTCFFSFSCDVHSLKRPEPCRVVLCICLVTSVHVVGCGIQQRSFLNQKKMKITMFYQA